MENEQKPNEQQISAKPTNSEHKTAQVGENQERMFQLSDLPRLTWKRNDGSELDVWSSEASDFQTYIQQFGEVENVDVTVWDVFDRLDYVNELYAYCQNNGFQYPFTVKPGSKSQEASA
jgi:spore coat polysaccharide biosynthesis protein SpsF (cytidylyltransferase family)